MSMTLVTLIQQLTSVFGTAFSSTAVIPVFQLFRSGIVSSAACSRYVSPLDTYDMYSSSYVSYTSLFSGLTVIVMYLDTSMGMPASSIY